MESCNGSCAQGGASEAAIVPIKVFQVLLSTFRYCSTQGASEAAIVPINVFQVPLCGNLVTCIVVLHRVLQVEQPSANKSIFGTSQLDSCIAVVHGVVEVKQGRRWVLTRLLQWPGVALCLHHLPTQPTQPSQARPSKGTQILFAKQPLLHHQDRPQPFNTSTMNLV